MVAAFWPRAYTSRSRFRFVIVLVPMALSLIEHEDLDKLPDGELSSSTEHSFYPASLVQVLRVTHQAKCSLIKVIIRNIYSI